MDRPQERLALIEVLERDGSVRRAMPVLRWPVSLGRALDNDLVVDDPHVAPYHAQLGPGGATGVLHVQALATRNGVQLGRLTLNEGESAPLPLPGTVWRVGATRLRVRLPGEPIEPERPLGLAASGARLLPTLACALAVWALALAQHAVALDPASSLTDWLGPLIEGPAVLLGWCAAWAMVSRTFHRRFDFGAHFAIVVQGVLALGLVDLLLPVVAFALSWEWLSRAVPAVEAVAAALVLFRQAVLALPLPRPAIGGALVACLVLYGVVCATLNDQRSDRFFSEPYLATLPPPGFRLASGVSPREFVEESAALKAQVDRRVAEDKASKD